MKFFHLSDLHIGKQLHSYNLKEDQEAILSQVVEAARRLHPDAVVIAGDIYDKQVPSAEAVTVFNCFLTELSDIAPPISVLITAGNHDSARRLDYASEILDRHHIHIAGVPPIEQGEYLKKVTFQDAYGEVDFYLLPFVKPGYVRNLLDDEMEGNSYTEAVRMLLEREDIDVSKRNVLVSHQFYTFGGNEPQRSDSEAVVVGGLDNVDAGVLEKFDYAALGHIHRPQQIGNSRFRYCGTLLKYSVSESEDNKHLLMVELGEKGTEPVYTAVPLSPIRDVRRLEGKFENILEEAKNKKLRNDYVSITVTDEVEPYQFRERLEETYPFLLEVRVENTRTRTKMEEQEEVMDISDPLQVFGRFFEEMQGRQMSREEEALLKDVLEEMEGQP
ncbi:exonuclease SbcCD subunit D [Dorea acetigenes]|uniref:Nuclease SbcCD subunit D n=1 Tax=Dorea acetigenes TaxID=2981787 RepID=A0ABT2RNS1_9FIRM|nr:exonuclease SbcCD subunit D [Dorea acetigenes]MCU6687013.1 exonuclease SbcCD subunit D [Dorea acetigenes]SCJ22143.1 Nuclease sbcCD subunit D [uncultured Clostridium sp.]